VDLELVPDRLRPHVSPPIRRLHLDLFSSNDASPEACARYRAEIESLRSQCNVLQWRSGVHSATTAGLACLAKVVRDEAIRMKSERDSFEERYNALKRKVRDEDDEQYSTACSQSSSTFADSASHRHSTSGALQGRRRCTDAEHSSSIKRVKREETLLTPSPPSSPPYFRRESNY